MSPAGRGALVVCPTPIGNLGDVTLRVLDELRRADAGACEDTRRTGTLLARLDIPLPLVSLHEHNERERAPRLVERIRRGERIALISDAGMPAVSDPGVRLIAGAHEAGIAVEVLPGPSAVTAALVASGFAGAAPDGAGFAFAGFLPRRERDLDALLDRLDATRLPLVAFESPKRVHDTLRALAARDPERPGAVCRELTKLHEEVARGTVAELAERFAGPARGEVTLVLGPAREEPRADPPADALAELAGLAGARGAADLASRLTGLPKNHLYRLLTGRR